MRAVGYKFVQDRLGLKLPPVAYPAIVRPVSRVERLPKELAVPAGRAPSEDALLDHILFALKHEGTELAVLAAYCDQLEPQTLLDALRRGPQGQYIRTLCAVWEGTTGRTLEDLPARVGGHTVPLFDPAIYVTTSPGVPNPRWRVTFNGLGDWGLCPTIRRTAELDQLLASDPLGQVLAFLKDASEAQVERVLAWAYLDETRSSFEIEGERPAASKTEAFAALLRTATEKQVLDEAHFVELQNAAVTSPFAREASFRNHQNHLHNGAPGAAGVTYLPPPPEMVRPLMASIARLANSETCPDLNPLLRAALASFGFVFVHPFEDGNGRLCRYLAHYALCQSGALRDGTILPLSTAMKRNETEYLRALQSFSVPTRRLWSVQWIDHDRFTFDFNGHPAVYRYWDATECATFLCRMALEAVRKDLLEEAFYLACHDDAVRAVNARFDIAGSLLSKLIRMAYANDGKISKNRRKQYGDRVEPEAFAFIEDQVATIIRRLDEFGAGHRASDFQQA